LTTDDRQMTDGPPMTYSKREREFMFAKNREKRSDTKYNISNPRTQTPRQNLPEPHQLETTHVQNYSQSEQFFTRLATQNDSRSNKRQLSKLNTSTSNSTIAEKLCDCCVGQFWPKVEDDILQPL